MNRDAMLAPLAEEEIRTFEGRGGRTMTFIEDETVMDRLDAGYGPGNWAINVEAVPYAEGVVKVRLGVREADEWVWYEDFGYPNQQGGDVLKESVSDGIRRCGRYVGIARDLYRKRTYERPAPWPHSHDDLAQQPPTPRAELERRADGLIGEVKIGAAPADLSLRYDPDGTAYWGFKLKAGKVAYQAFATGSLAEALDTAAAVGDSLEGQNVTVWGKIEMVPWRKGDREMPPYARIIIERMQTADWLLPAQTIVPGQVGAFDDPITDEEAAAIIEREKAEAAL